MSRALGEHGYNGRDYPAALAMHMFNKGVAEKLNITIPKIENHSELADEGGYCTAYPNSGNDATVCAVAAVRAGRSCAAIAATTPAARVTTTTAVARASGMRAKCWTNWGAAFFGC